jgi:esterase/lipase superfamily enzyme
MKTKFILLITCIIATSCASLRTASSSEEAITGDSTVASTAFSWQKPKLDSLSSQIKNNPFDQPLDGYYRRDTTSASAKLSYTTVKIFFGTDRVKVINNDRNSPGFNFGSETTRLTDNYFVGYTIVTIPKSHKQGIIDKNSLLKLQLFKTANNSMIQKSITVLSDYDFNKIIHNTSNKTDAFIFVHGYNNTFEDAALRTAQLVQDIDYPLTPFMYSWASNGQNLDYIGDATNCNLATTFFLRFLRRIAKNGNYKHLHIIAHSMGNRLIANAMDSLAMSGEYKKLRISEIIMAAPDIDVETFKAQNAKAISLCCDRATIYGAKNDWALILSHLIGKYVRVGQYGKPPFYLDGVSNIDFINADSVKTGFLGHDRFAESPTILKDMSNLMEYRKPVSKRSVPHQLLNKRQYYYFTPDKETWILF